MASTGAEVTWKGQTAKTPNGKTRVDLKYTNGKEVTSYWGTNTEVGVKGPEDKSEEKLDEVKYKLKLGAKAAPATAEPPTDSAPAEEPTDDLDFSTDDAGTEDQADTSSEPPADDTATDDSGASDKPFDDEPFDAGVEADEESDPKKFIEQLTGKLGQSLRKYTEDQGEPDFDLEKFAVNSLLSATHTGEMDSEDQKDIIKKVKSSGKGDSDEESTDDTETTDDTDTETTDTETTDTETTDDGETTDTETTDTEETDDSENMFETEMLDEMSLDDWKSKMLIKIYDDNLKQGNTKILHILTRLVSFSDKINREEFLQDIQAEISDNEEMYYILDKLKDLGVDVDSYEEAVDYNRMFENAFILKNIKKNNMFQEGSNDILDEYEIYEVVEEGKKKKKKTKKDACYHKVRARYDVWPSAYASGALVKCRKAGAANWGNSTDESVELTEAVGKDAMKRKCTVIAKRKHNKFPSAKAVEDIMACVAGKIWADEIKKLNETEELESLKEKWSAKYKKSIDCNNPKGFSQKAHCQGRKKHE
jgi:hypothetical protein